jgi:tRNA A-37 threonylcarbamoyl transferase component Bud32
MEPDNPRWWALSNDIIWKADGLSVIFLRAGSKSDELQITSERGTEKILFHRADGIATTLQWHKHKFAILSKQIETASGCSPLTPRQQFILDCAADALHEQSIPLRVLRQKLGKKFPGSSGESNKAIDTLVPRFVYRSDDNLYLQMLGLQRSALWPTLVPYVDEALAIMHQHFDDDAAATSMEASQLFARFTNHNPAVLGNALWICQLARQPIRGGGRWMFANDQELLHEQNVKTSIEFEAYCRNVAPSDRRMPVRPWSTAFVKQDWSAVAAISHLFEMNAKSESNLQLVTDPLRAEGSGAVAMDAPAVHDEPTVDHKLPRLSVKCEERIGAGAFGTVWRAIDELLERPLAVKFLTGTDQGLDEQSLLREAKVLAKVAHPNLVVVYGAAWLRNPAKNGLVAPALMMELLDGENLNVWYQKVRSLTEVIKVAKGLVLGVQALHNANVSHTDLHEENIRVLSNGSTKIIDWRYQDTILQRSTSGQKELRAADLRRMVDLCRTMLEKNGHSDKAEIFRGELTIDRALFIFSEIDKPFVQPSAINIAALTRAVEGIERQTSDCQARIVDYMKWMTTQLQDVYNTAREQHSSEPGDEVLSKALAGTTDLVAGFAGLVTQVARHRHEMAAGAVMKGFEVLLAFCHVDMESQVPSWKTTDFDFYKFVVHELLLCFVSKLASDDLYDLLRNVLAMPIYVRFRSEPPIEHWSVLSQFYPALLERERKQRLQLEVHSVTADLLKSRHSTAPLDALSPWMEIRDADFLLAMMNSAWSPWVLGDLQYPAPKFLARAETKVQSLLLARLCGLSSVEQLRERYDEVLSRMQVHPRLLDRLPKSTALGSR